MRSRPVLQGTGVPHMSLYVQETGPAGAPTIVFLHGGGGSGWMWQPQVDGLSDYHCLVPDLPEQGRSVDVKPFTIAGSAELIAELIRTRAHGGRAHVVGVSEGAQTTVALLAIAHDLVDHAVVSSAMVRPIRGAGMVGPGLIRWSFRLFVAPFRNIGWWTRLNMKRAAGVPDEYYWQFRQTFRELTESGFTNAMIENQRFRVPQGLDSVTAPTLIVVGRREYGTMRDSARDLATALPGSLACEVVHARKMSVAEEHNWNLTAPDLFTKMVRAWITGQELPAELQPLQAVTGRRGA
jgi:pimeloyl-ACP methyl ester carboxylesterase